MYESDGSVRSGRLLIAACAAAVVFSGCGGESSSDGAAKDEKAARDQAIREDPSSVEPATDMDEFRPVLEKAYASAQWPDRFEMSLDEMEERMRPAAIDLEMTDVDAIGFVEIWSICAWSLELVAEVDEGASSDSMEVAADHIRQIAQSMPGFGFEDALASAKLGDKGSLVQFVDANDCRAGFGK